MGLSPSPDRKPLVHFHCHQRATSDTHCDQRVLERIGLDYEVLDTGCCGLAGSFGYERGERYEVSVRAGEQTLLPAVREASPHTLLLTDGFSCRSQIEHGSDRSALHLAQALQMALHDGPNGPSAARPERLYSQQPNGAASGAAIGAAAAGAVGAAAVARGWRALAKRRS
jgi:hypothetical protein